MADRTPETSELWERIKAKRDAAVRERLALSYLPLVHTQARILAGRVPPSVKAEDLEGYGMIGLLEAIDRFDPDRGIPFEAFARLRIRGAMYDYLRTLDLLPRVARRTVHRVQAEAIILTRRLGRAPTDEELAESTGMAAARVDRALVDAHAATPVSLEGEFGEVDHLPAALARDAGGDVLTRLEQEALDGELWRATAALPVRHKVVVGLYYCEGLTLAEIGRILGVTESRASQLRSEALETLRTHLSLRNWLDGARNNQNVRAPRRKPGTRASA
ncbi:MAG: FliA/WhiG family RNA polymerase sigma factor [Dehalococcoidia bacterium]|nr:FliA/WhiG family RNA polymerase sigma factor [Dehalococcoidia bacterium]